MFIDDFDGINVFLAHRILCGNSYQLLIVHKNKLLLKFLKYLKIISVEVYPFVRQTAMSNVLISTCPVFSCVINRTPSKPFKGTLVQIGKSNNIFVLT